MKKFFALFFVCLILSYPALAMEAKLVEKETRYGKISYPQISGLADENIENSINRIILEEAAQWNCDFDGPRTDEEADRLDYNAWSVIHTASDEVLSYSVHKDLYCSGAHPSQYIETRNYDLTTGTPVHIFNLLDENLLSGAKLTEFLLKGHTFAEDGCAEAYVDVNWDYYLVPGHAVFLPRLAGRDSPCWEEFKVENERLAPYFPVPMTDDDLN